MASEAAVKQLQEQLDVVNRYIGVDLISRPAWGEITFEIAQQDIDLARSIAIDLTAMPLTYLTDRACEDITGHIPNVATHLQQIDDFKLEGTPAANRNAIAANLKDAVESLHSVTSHWIPYLAYKHGDISESTRQIGTALADAKDPS